MKVHRHFFNRGSKSRNKVAVGEPAAGSFFRSKTFTTKKPCQTTIFCVLLLFGKKNAYSFLYVCDCLLLRQRFSFCATNRIHRLCGAIFRIRVCHAVHLAWARSCFSASGTRTELTSLERFCSSAYAYLGSSCITAELGTPEFQGRSVFRRKHTRTQTLAQKIPHTTPHISKKTGFGKLKTLLSCRSTTVDDGSHNVSRWMTWLPISLKNAAKCDKWYQLQNLSLPNL